MVGKVPFALLVGISVAFGIYEYVVDMASLRIEAGVHHLSKNAASRRIQQQPILQKQPPQQDLHTVEKETQDALLPQQLRLQNSNGVGPTLHNHSIAKATMSNNKEGYMAQNRSIATDSTQTPAPGRSATTINAASNTTVEPSVRATFAPLEVNVAARSGGNSTIKAGNYFQLLQQGTFGQWASELPPVQLMKTYIQSHSQKAL
jgi:hypothetical protein